MHSSGRTLLDLGRRDQVNLLICGVIVDDGFGYLEFLHLSEDLGTAPIWLINNGISHHDVGPIVQDVLDGIEFARGPATSRWGPPYVVASAIAYTSSTDKKSYIKVKVVVNFNDNPATFEINFYGLDKNTILSNTTKTLLTYTNVKDENSFEEPTKITLVQSLLENGKDMSFQIPRNLVTA